MRTQHGAWAAHCVSDAAAAGQRPHARPAHSADPLACTHAALGAGDPLHALAHLHLGMRLPGLGGMQLVTRFRLNFHPLQLGHRPPLATSPASRLLPFAALPLRVFCVRPSVASLPFMHRVLPPSARVRGGASTRRLV